MDIFLQRFLLNRNTNKVGQHQVMDSPQNVLFAEVFNQMFTLSNSFKQPEKYYDQVEKNKTSIITQHILFAMTKMHENRSSLCMSHTMAKWQKLIARIHKQA